MKNLRGADDETKQSQATYMHWISNSAKALVKKAAPGALLVLLGVGAVYLVASRGFTPRTVASSTGSVDVSAAAERKNAQTAPPDDNDRVIVPSGPVGLDANEAHRRTIAENNSAIDQTTAPVLAPAPTPDGRKPVVSDREFLETQQPESGHKSFERQSRVADRKSLERTREAAERKRARLEEMYQKHLISSEAYKKGEEKYKSEIEKYRSAVSAAVSKPLINVPEGS